MITISDTTDPRPTFHVYFDRHKQSIEANFGFCNPRSITLREVRTISIIAEKFEELTNNVVNQLIDPTLLANVKANIQYILQSACYETGIEFQLNTNL